MRYIIDRFEGDFAIVELESKEVVNIPKIALPGNSREGDVIILLVDKNETEKRKNMILEKFNRIQYKK
jgi:hypothetical protein